MDEDPVLLVGGFFNEIEDFLGYLVMVIKDQLSVIIEPVKGEVLDSHRSPLVEHLPTCAVYYVSHLVRYHKLQILGSILISKEEAILDFDRSEDIYMLYCCLCHSARLFFGAIFLVKVGLVGDGGR